MGSDGGGSASWLLLPSASFSILSSSLEVLRTNLDHLPSAFDEEVVTGGAGNASSPSASA